MEEIERKFLVTSIDFIAQSNNQNRIVQGYLNSNPSRTVRVRIKGAKGFLTIKGKGNASGTTRFEWETEIAVAEAELLLQLCEKGIIDKILEWIAGLASETEINGIFQIILKLRYKHFQNSLRLNLFQLFGQ